MTITQSEQAPLIIVVGATGNQGGSVLNHLRESDKEYRIRALTRDSTKPKAKEIEATGAQTFQIDLKPENKDKMLEAFSGAHAIFVSLSCVNGYLAPANPSRRWTCCRL
jgi:uncharacterized protein YbjT (DUF2867 family)